MAKLAQTEGVKRIDAFVLDPELCTIIRDKDHPRYDPRAELPVSEPLVLNIMAHGVKVPILIAKRGKGDETTYEVVNGRQRVKAALEANKRLKKEGKEPVRIKAVFEHGTDSDLYGVMVISNEHDQKDGIVQKLAKANKLRSYGKTDEEIANIFGVTRAAIGQWSKLDGCCPDVIDAIDAGAISASAAAALSGLKVPDQKAKLSTLTASGKKVTTKQAKKAARGDNSTEPKRISNETIKTYHDNEACPDDVKDVLGWVLGIRKTPPFELEQPKVNGLT